MKLSRLFDKAVKLSYKRLKGNAQATILPQSQSTREFVLIRAAI